MLVISRKVGQKIMINDDIEISIVSSRNGVCRIAINAPKDVKIYREEIYVQIKLANLMGQDSMPVSLDEATELLKQKDVQFNQKTKSIDSEDEILYDESKKREQNTRLYIKKKPSNEL